jgi:hypothetical protein
MTAKFLLTLLVFGLVLMGAGLYSAQVYGYILDPAKDTPQTSFTLGQFLYFQNPNQSRQYLGQILGIYSVGTSMCPAYIMNEAKDVLECEKSGDPPETIWSGESGWGILFQYAAPGEVTQVSVPSIVYAIIPKMDGQTLNGYTIARITELTANDGHKWEIILDDKMPVGLSGNSALGVELVLHKKYEYPETLFPN